MPAAMNTMCAPSSRARISVDRFFGGFRADFRAGACAEAGSGACGQVDAGGWRRGPRQRLSIGIGDDELDALQVGFDHVVDGIAAGAAHAEHEDPRLKFLGHGAPQSTSASAGGWLSRKNGLLRLKNA
jgi:hypothetical protein